MSVCLNLALVLGAVAVALRSSNMAERLFRFWVFGENVEWDDEEESPSVLSAMFQVISLKLVFSLLYAVVLSLFVKFPSSTSLSDYLPKFGIVKFLAVMIVAVVAEEFAFRWIPLVCGYMVQGIFKRDWYRNLGIISSLLFGLYHITNYENPDPSFIFLVVPQVVGGLLMYWFALKYKHGWAFATYAHFLFNFVLLLSDILGLK